jgi:anti-anti-sigma factor
MPLFRTSRRGSLGWTLASTIDLQGDPGEPVVVVTGDADLTAAGALGDALSEAAATTDRVVVDLSGATLIDSRTIGTLANWATELSARGGGLMIVCADPEILRLFRTIGLESSFDFYPDRNALGERESGSST